LETRNVLLMLGHARKVILNHAETAYMGLTKQNVYFEHILFVCVLSNITHTPNFSFVIYSLHKVNKMNIQ